MKSSLLTVFLAASIVTTACSRDPVKTSQAYLDSGDRYAKAGQRSAIVLETR